jgi:hypothetical protein
VRFGHAICAQNYRDWKRFKSGVDKPLDYPDHRLMSEALELAVLADGLVLQPEFVILRRGGAGRRAATA